MKSTLPRQKTANPRRTTLAHLKDISELGLVPVELPEPVIRPLPQRTANPRRTILNELPKAPVEPATPGPDAG